MSGGKITERGCLAVIDENTTIKFQTRQSVQEIINLVRSGIPMVSECFTEMSYARRRSDSLLIEFDENGCFKSAILNGEEKTREWLDAHNERSYWDIGLRGVEQ